MFKIISSIFILVFVVGFSFSESLIYRYRPAIDEVCSIVIENYFDSSAIEKLTEDCLKARSNFPKFASTRQTARIINELLSSIATSHLTLFEPEESNQMWFHESIDNGIRARDVSGIVVIYEVLPKSPAEKAGLRKGDEILMIDQEAVHMALDVLGKSGSFMVVRNEHTQSFLVQAEKYEEDDSLKVDEVNPEVAVLRIKSFLSPFFENEKLDAVFEQLVNYPNIDIDLRGNIGGSFPAMLRLLSKFTCEPELVGTLQVSQSHQVQEEDLADDLDTEHQLAQIERVKKLNLRSFETKNCLKAKLWILVDRGTSSVSEIFADYFQTAGRAKILGRQTAGEVVMAKWFAITSLGLGADGTAFSLSVPIANFHDFQLKNLEETGVRPDIFLEYSLEEALQGRDSWIDEILKMRHK